MDFVSGCLLVSVGFCGIVAIVVVVRGLEYRIENLERAEARRALAEMASR